MCIVVSSHVSVCAQVCAVNCVFVYMNMFLICMSVYICGILVGRQETQITFINMCAQG